MVAEVGYYIMHDINQQWYDPLLLVTVEHHVQQMSQHLSVIPDPSVNMATLRDIHPK